MVSIRLSGVSLRGLEGRPFQECPNCWWLDLSKNALESLNDAGLDAYYALGLVDVSQNHLKPDALKALRDVEVVQLNVRGNDQSVSPKLRN